MYEAAYLGTLSAGVKCATEVELLDYLPHLSTEQFWMLANILKEFSISSIQKSREKPLVTHELFQASILNLDTTSINLTSSKYRNRAIRWATYNTPDYSDDHLIGPIAALPYYLAALIAR